MARPPSEGNRPEQSPITDPSEVGQLLLKLIKDAVPAVPRKLNRVGELFDLYLKIAKRNEWEMVSAKEKLTLLRLVILQLQAPEIARFGRQNRAFLRRMEDWVDKYKKQNFDISVLEDDIRAEIKENEEALKINADDIQATGNLEFLKQRDQRLVGLIREAQQHRSGFNPFRLLDPNLKSDTDIARYFNLEQSVSAESISTRTYEPEYRVERTKKTQPQQYSGQTATASKPTSASTEYQALTAPIEIRTGASPVQEDFYSQIFSTSPAAWQNAIESESEVLSGHIFDNESFDTILDNIKKSEGFVIYSWILDLDPYLSAEQLFAILKTSKYLDALNLEENNKPKSDDTVSESSTLVDILALLAVKFNPPHSPVHVPVNLMDLLESSDGFDLSNVSLQHTWMRGLQLGKSKLPEKKNLENTNFSCADLTKIKLKAGQLDHSYLLHAQIPENYKLKTSVLNKLPDSPSGVNLHINHTEKVTDLLALNEGCFLSSGTDGLICLWNENGFSPLKIFTTYSGPVNSLARHDTRHFFSAGSDGRIYYWNIEQYLAISNFTDHEAEITELEVINPQRLLAAYGDGALHLWDIEQKTVIRKFAKHTGVALCLAKVDERTVLIGGDDNVIRLWDVESEIILHEFSHHNSPVTSLLVLNKSLALSADSDGMIYRLDLNQKQFVNSYSHPAGLTTMANNDQNGFIFADINGMICYQTLDFDNYKDYPVSTTTQSEISSLIARAEDKFIIGGDSWIASYDGNYSNILYQSERTKHMKKYGIIMNDSTYLVVDGENRNVEVWEADREVPRQIFNHLNNIISIHVINSSQFLTITDDSQAHIWEPGKAMVIKSQFLGTTVYDSDIFSDSEILLLGPSGIITIININSFTTSRQISGIGDPQINSLHRFSDQLLIVTTDERVIKIIDSINGRVVREFNALNGQVTDIAICNEESFIAVTDAGELAFLSVDVNLVDRRFSYSCALTCAALWGTEKCITGSVDGTIQIWEFDKDTPIGVYAGHLGPVNSVTVSRTSPDGIISTGQDGRRVWDIYDGKVLQWINRFPDYVVMQVDHNGISYMKESNQPWGSLSLPNLDKPLPYDEIFSYTANVMINNRWLVPIYEYPDFFSWDNNDNPKKITVKWLNEHYQTSIMGSRKAGQSFLEYQQGKDEVVEEIETQ